jgi:tetrahydromethanopterin S-methyltransferase subunit C
VAAAATAAANANTASIVGGIVGTVAAIIIGFVVRRVYERRQIHARRLRKLETSKGTANTVQTMRALYGVSGEENVRTTVMYQVTTPQAQENMRQYASRRGRGV